ncbi:nascent polypeptide associated complex alpha chain, putative [Plasmodium chabaudi chabaudi]|uniref:Nascent polypeptide associated complex alpha chain, putative n=2 Tax=Plasmodium chabaudi TaxID=5825 RepID=A0A077TKT0_PLACU|nr:nascent polypeptide-associated complex subunit alpha, putative [Plasmodium chabaudi chabaudi]SCM22445.1 nascent polypeptide associated complex alpha chain, putative [Plasmodium chabaudi adami]SCM23699.1 nascent polypeptide associated complex alpha chain, putative [Plasmodium chabaudi chabaudi]SCN61157.1 nascent polypeptide associated complex alpha chain, putative [Plasmodium chabaudi chabaudi]SCN61158.1 nascent polypeptide associated complex alpha chain, putative [Plasmodium chabaudi adami]|eukprot:XP_745334.1 nascent polypeptide associated complex alpha chain, putative [Plasmodium chabaudi chabaudi]
MQDDKINSKDDISSSSSCEENEENRNILNPPNRPKMSKGERRARKMLVKLGLKAIPNTHKVIIKKSQKMIFAVSNVDIYQIEGTDSYVIFGDAKTDEITNSFNSLLPDSNLNEGEAGAEQEVNFEDAEKADEKVQDLENGEKAKDVSMDDVDLIISQTKCSKERAIEVLKKNNNDLVQSIMELSG